MKSVETKLFLYITFEKTCKLARKNNIFLVPDILKTLWSCCCSWVLLFFLLKYFLLQTSICYQSIWCNCLNKRYKSCKSHIYGAQKCYYKSHSWKGKKKAKVGETLESIYKFREHTQYLIEKLIKNKAASTISNPVFSLEEVHPCCYNNPWPEVSEHTQYSFYLYLSERLAIRQLSKNIDTLK